MNLHRTPVHHDALRLVRDGRVMWRDTEPATGGKPVPRPSAGFARPRGGWFEPELLVALWELRQAKLITVDGGVVLLSRDGRSRLADWDATQVVRS